MSNLFTFQPNLPLSIYSLVLLYTANRLRNLRRDALRTLESTSTIETEQQVIDNSSSTGSTGPTGLSGLSIVGSTGSTGPDGPQGPQGFQGPIGLTGNTGLIGFKGFDGPAGLGGPSFLVPASVWTTRKTPNYNDPSPSYNPSRIATDGNNIFLTASSNSNILMRSADGGNTWAYSNFYPEDSDPVPVIAYGNGIFLAISSINDYSFFSSDGGLNWNLIDGEIVIGKSITYQRLRYFPAVNLFVAVGYNNTDSTGFIAYFNPDFTLWTVYTSSTFNGVTLYDIALVDSAAPYPDYVIVGSNGGGKIYRGDFFGGFADKTPANCPNVRTVVANSDFSIIVAAGEANNNNSYAYSTDSGNNWTTVFSGFSGLNLTFQSMVYVPSKNIFVAVADPGPNNGSNNSLQFPLVYTTSDGISWTRRNASSQMQWNDITASDNKLVAVASNSFTVSGFQSFIMTSDI
jgi:hypothetical protein